VVIVELVVANGPDRGTRLEVGTAAITIGRDLDNDVVLTDGAVSKRHAIVRLLSAGALELTDLGSRNGTWVDEQRATGPVQLPAGGRFRLGSDVFVIGQGSSIVPPPTPVQGHRPVAAPPPQPVVPSGVSNAGPVAGGDISLAGHHVAGRDLYYQEGFRFRSRMTSSAKRVLRVGVALIFIGMFMGVGGVIAFQQWIINQSGVDPDMSTREAFDQEPFGDIAVFFLVVGGGALLSLIGLVAVVTSLLMRREQIRERVPPKRA
jgi:hypothetical protein